MKSSKPDQNYDASIAGIVTMPLATSQGYPHVLRNTCTEVDLSRDRALDECAWIATYLFQVMWERDGVAIAAPQVGFTNRLVVINNSPRISFSPAVMINPSILERSESLKSGMEACLSLPGYEGRVSRNEWVRFEYWELDGTRQEFTVEGYEARVVQHELDHLDGTLYIDRIVKWPKDLWYSESTRLQRARVAVETLMSRRKTEI